MSQVELTLESVQVIEGQGISEGDFELRVQAQEGSNNVVWPALNSSATVDKNGAPYTINRRIGLYEIASGSLTKRIALDLTEVDKSLNGQNDYGQGSVELTLTPTMCARPMQSPGGNALLIVSNEVKDPVRRD